MMPREQEFHGFQEDDLQQEEAKEKARNFNLLYNCHLLESGIVSRTKDVGELIGIFTDSTIFEIPN